MREVTLLQRGTIADPAVRAALQEIETASHENALLDVGEFGQQLLETGTLADAQELLGGDAFGIDLFGTATQADALTLLGSITGAITDSFDTVAEAMAANIDPSLDGIRVKGFAAAGDKGAADYKRVVSLVSADAGFQSADGAYWQIAMAVLRPEMFSATASTQAIQLAIDVANLTGAGEVRLTVRNYAASALSGHDYCIHLYGPVSLIADAPGTIDGVTVGTGSIISWGSGVSSSTDILLWTGFSSGQKIIGIRWMPDNFNANSLALPASIYGRDVIRINSGATSVIENGQIADNLIGPCNGNSIRVIDSVGGDWVDGTIENNWIWGGILCNGLLDNTRFTHNNFNGEKLAMDLAYTVGAANSIVSHNHGVAAGGAVRMHNGIDSAVINNYFETAQNYVSSTTSGYLYCFDGDLGTIKGLDFKDNLGAMIGASGTLSTNPFTTVNASTTVTVAHTAHGRIVGDTVVFSGASVFNNVTMNGAFTVASVPNANSYTVTAGTSANASGSGGGAVVVYRYGHRLTGIAYFANTTFTDFDGNDFYNGNPATPIKGAYFASNNYKPYIGALVDTLVAGGITPTTGSRPGVEVASPATVMPRGYDIPLTLVTGSAGAETPAIRVSRTGEVFLVGDITGGAIIAGTGLSTVPAGACPLNDTYRIGIADNGTTFRLKITSGGVLTYDTAPASNTRNSIACAPWMTAP